MANEARLNELLDIVEQARREGDTVTEQKAAAAYKRESVSELEKPWYNKSIPGLGIPLMSEAGPLADLKRGAGLAARSGINAVTGIPLMAADIGVGARRAITKEPLDLPSYTWNHGLDALGMPNPETTGEKVTDFLGQVVIGGKLPVPQSAAQAPTNFAKIDPARLSVLKRSQEAGYVVPPSTTNPTMTNRLIESLGGKKATEQDARVINQEITDLLARKAIGLHPDQPVTATALKDIRQEAAQAYEALRKVGTMRADSQYTSALDNVLSKYKGAEKDFPELAKTEVTNIVQAMKKKSFDSNSAVDAISILRSKADDAFASGEKTIGGAYKAISKALEDAVERSLERRGKDAAPMLQSFKNARANIAKTYSVEKALNQSTGNVDAIALARALGKGAPLSGSLKQAAEFGQAFSPAARVPLDSGGVRALDAGVGIVGAAVTKEPSLLTYPFSRMAARDFLLSKTGQKLATPRIPWKPNAMSAAQAIENLFSAEIE